MIKILRPCERGMFSITFRNTDQADELKEKTNSGGARARRARKSCSGSMVKSRMVMPNECVHLFPLEVPPGVLVALFAPPAIVNPTPPSLEASGVGWGGRR